MNLETLINTAKNINVGISTNWLLERLQDRYRWPVSYFYGQPTVEVILEDGSKTHSLFLKDGYVDSNLVLDFYEKGYTVLLSRMQRIHPDIIKLAKLTDNYSSFECNMNIYFGKGLKSISFPRHTHDYAVLVKSVEGESEWEIGKETKILKNQDVIYFDSHTPHWVKKIVYPKLTITCNLGRS